MVLAVEHLRVFEFAGVRHSPTRRGSTEKKPQTNHNQGRYVELLEVETKSFSSGFGTNPEITTYKIFRNFLSGRAKMFSLVFSIPALDAWVDGRSEKMNEKRNVPHKEGY